MNEAENRRSDQDRRNAKDRRRRTQGLFELRARPSADRRQAERRGESKFRLAFWRRRSS